MDSGKKVWGRKRRQHRVRKRVRGSDGCPRVCVFRSSKHIYAQLISDESGHTLLSVSTLSSRGGGDQFQRKGVDAAREIGRSLAGRCKEKGISHVVFDRNGFLYHGRVKALAEGAREGGLRF